MTRVALIDDHESVRLGLEAACARAGTKEVVFSGSTVRAYLDWRAQSGAPPADIVVLDLTLGDGTTVTENVTRLVADGSPVLIHSVADRAAAVREALAAGATGIISKASRTGVWLTPNFSCSSARDRWVPGLIASERNCSRRKSAICGGRFRRSSACRGATTAVGR